MVLFAQIDQNLLSLTGVIATILSVIFGIAAFYNSRTRKKHLQDLERSQKQEHAIHFRPATPSSNASRSSHPSRSSKPYQSNSAYFSDQPSSAPKAAPVAKPAQPTEKRFESSVDKPGAAASSKDTPALFRKVKPTGSGKSDLDPKTDDKDTYVWE